MKEARGRLHRHVALCELVDRQPHLAVRTLAQHSKHRVVVLERRLRVSSIKYRVSTGTQSTEFTCGVWQYSFI